MDDIVPKNGINRLNILKSYILKVIFCCNIIKLDNLIHEPFISEKIRKNKGFGEYEGV